MPLNLLFNTPDHAKSTTPVGAEPLRIADASPQWLQEWQALDNRLGSPYLSCSAEWTRIWIRHYGNLIPHRIAVLSSGTDIVGMCLLSQGVGQHDGPFAIKTIHVGTAGEPEGDSVCVEYNHLLTSPQYRPEFARQLMQSISQQESCEYFVLDGMNHDDTRAFIDLNAPTEVNEVPCHYCDLNAIRSSTHEPWRMFGTSTRTNLRRSLRDLGPVELDWGDTADQALDFYEEMIGYHRLRWNASGKAGAFSSSRFTEFHRDLIAAMVPAGRAVMVRARQASRVLGILYLMIQDNRLLYYQAGLPEHQSKLSLGNVTQYLTMLEGARRGYDAFDFMAGDAQYKRVLSTHHNTLYWAKWRRPSVKFLVLDGLRTLKTYLSEL